MGSFSWRTCAVQPLLYTFFVLLGAAAVSALPLCRDHLIPKKPSSALSFCSDEAYSTLGCCSIEDDKNIESTVKALNISSEGCLNIMKKIYCSQCDPFAAYLYGAASSPESAAATFSPPYLCSSVSNTSATSYCTTVYETCSTVPMVGSPYAAKKNYAPYLANRNQSTILQSYYPSELEFCSGNQNPETPSPGRFCYEGSPYEPPAVSRVMPPGPGICMEQLARGKYIDFIPHPDGSARAFLVSQKGVIYLVDLPEEGNQQPITDSPVAFLDISSLVAYDGEESGLLGLAFHPNFLSNGLFYVSYICDSSVNNATCSNFVCPCNITSTGCTQEKLEKYAADGGWGTGYCRNATVVAEYSVVGNRSTALLAQTSETRRILTYGQPFRNHKAGQLHFGPIDGYLYLQMGDGGADRDPFNFAANLDVLLGKVIRVNVNQELIGSNVPYGRYDLPPENPYYEAAKTTSTRAEIFAAGLSDPARCSFDRAAPAYFYCGDQGQDAIEEIDLVVKSGDYKSQAGPVLTYERSNSSSKIIGGFVSRSEKDACLNGRYLFAVSNGKFFAGVENPPWSGKFTKSALKPKCASTSPISCTGNLWNSASTQIAAWGQDNNATLYVLSNNGIFRVTSPSRCGLTCTQSLPPMGPPPPPTVYSPPPPIAPAPAPSPALSPALGPALAPSSLTDNNGTSLTDAPGASLRKESDSDSLEAWLLFGAVAFVWTFAICGCCILGYCRYNRPRKDHAHALPLIQPDVVAGPSRLPADYYGQDEEGYVGQQRAYTRAQSQDM